MAKTSSERRARLAAALLLATLGSGCTQLDNALASVPFLAFMRNSQAIEARNYLNGIEHLLPVVLAGDFNSQPKTYVIDQFHRVNRAGTACEISAPLATGSPAPKPDVSAASTRSTGCSKIGTKPGW